MVGFFVLSKALEIYFIYLEIKTMRVINASLDQRNRRNIIYFCRNTQLAHQKYLPESKCSLQGSVDRTFCQQSIRSIFPTFGGKNSV